MPRIKAEILNKKIECKINLSANAKELLVQSARDLKLNQNEIVENMILNFNSHKDIIKNSKYILEKENLLTQMIKRIEENINFNKLVLEKIDIQNEKLENFDNSIKSFETKFGEYREKSRKLIDNNKKTFDEQYIDLDEKIQKMVADNKSNPLRHLFGK